MKRFKLLITENIENKEYKCLEIKCNDLENMIKTLVDLKLKNKEE